jgi:putative transposase
MKTLKHEEVDASAYQNLAQARALIGQFIETVYNRQRLHSALHYLSLEEFETNRRELWTASPQPTALWTAIPRPTAPTTTVPI